MGAALYHRGVFAPSTQQQMPTPPISMVQASAPVKCIPIWGTCGGFGQPAVAVAIDQRMTVSLEKNSEWRIDGMKFISKRHPHVEKH